MMPEKKKIEGFGIGFVLLASDFGGKFVHLSHLLLFLIDALYLQLGNISHESKEDNLILIHCQLNFL